MILTVLGTNGPFPAAGGACSGYLLSSDSGDTRILIDCGSGVLGRLAEVCPLEKLSAAVLSHLHYDHMSDMLPMQYALDFHGIQSLRVLCPETPAKARGLLSGGRMDLFGMNDIQIGEMKLEFLRVCHPVECYAVRVICDGATFVYTGDTNQCDALPLFADGADLLLADAGFLKESWTPQKPHMCAEMCALLARETRAAKLLLTHINPLLDAEALLDEALAVYPDAILAQPGMRVRV